MTWENAINIKLNLSDISRQIISDRTGILFSAEFISFLQSNNTSFILCHSFAELIPLSESNDVKIIITSLKEIPDYLSAKADIKKFNLFDLPINADVQALEQLNSTELVLLLNYLNATNLLQSVNKANIQSLLINARVQQQKVTSEKLISQIESVLLSEVNYENILQIGVLFGQLQYAVCQHSTSIDQNIIKSLQLRIDEYSFNYILQGNLKNIFYESVSNVRSVSSIIPFIKSNSFDKIALICFDCMGLSEWLLLKEYLQPLKLSFNEHSTFSLIPSITSISRAAIYYSSNTEVFSLSSVNEPKAFQQQFPGKSCRFFREKDSITADALLGIESVSVIYNFFDDISHSIKLPVNCDNKTLYFDAVKNYLNSSAIIDDIQLLIDEGYNLFFCSDHGSVIATGNGKKIDKYLQDKFAKRSCLIQDTTLAEFLDFPQMKIPFVDDKILVLPEGRTMFDNLNYVGISHGGITVEEIVVPFIEVKKC